MKKIDQFEGRQAELELHKLLRQHLTNMEELAKHFRNADVYRDTLRSVYEAVDAVDDWVGAAGQLKIIVMWQPNLFSRDDNDDEYADVPF